MESAVRDIETLLAAYQQADREATSLLIHRVNPVLYRYFYGHTRNRQEAEDLVQEAWLRIHRARHTYRPGLPALPWLYSIADHTRIDIYRKRKRSTTHEVACDEPAEPAHRASAPTAAQINWNGLLAKLPESQREVLVLMKYSGLSLDEVARLKGSTIGAVKLKAHRAYESLKAMLKRKEAGK